MNLRKTSAFLSDLSRLMSDPHLCDLQIQCCDGTINAPRLILAAALDNSPDNPLLEALAEPESYLLLPHAAAKEVKGFLGALFFAGGSTFTMSKASLECLSGCVDWSRWMTERREVAATTERKQRRSSASSHLISKAILEDVVGSLPLEVEAIRTINEQPYPKRYANSLLASAVLRQPKQGYGGVGCPICGKVLRDRRNLRRHEDAVHLNIRPHGCDRCPKRFSARGDLREHVMAVHDKIKACICEVCGAALSTRHALRTHMLRHPDDSTATAGHAPFSSSSSTVSCAQCGRSFRHVSTYRKHVSRVHEFSPARRLQCPHCPGRRLFNHKEGLNRHVKKFHSDLTDQFRCPSCPAAFAFKYDLNRHQRRLHPEALADPERDKQQQQQHHWQQQQPQVHQHIMHDGLGAHNPIEPMEELFVQEVHQYTKISQ